MGTALTGNTTSDLVVLMKNVPTEANVSNTMQKAGLTARGLLTGV